MSWKESDRMSLRSKFVRLASARLAPSRYSVASVRLHVRPLEQFTYCREPFWLVGATKL